jgi:hypothetical protein
MIDARSAAQPGCAQVAAITAHTQSERMKCQALQCRRLISDTMPPFVPCPGASRTMVGGSSCEIMEPSLNMWRWASQPIPYISVFHGTRNFFGGKRTCRKTWWSDEFGRSSNSKGFMPDTASGWSSLPSGGRHIAHLVVSTPTLLATFISSRPCGVSRCPQVTISPFAGTSLITRGR